MPIKPDLPPHLLYIADAVEQGKNIRHQADKLRKIIASAVSMNAVDMSGLSEKESPICAACHADMKWDREKDRSVFNCPEECPRAQLKEALSDAD